MGLTVLLIEKIASFFLLILCGFLLSKLGIFDRMSAQVIACITVYATTPAMIINSFIVEYTQDRMHDFLAMMLFAIAVHIIFFIVSNILGIFGKATNCDRAVLIFSNAASLVFALVDYVLGHEYTFYAVPYVLFQTVFFWTYGVVLLSKKENISLKQILTSLPLIACFVGITLFVLRIQIPTIIKATMESLGSMNGTLSFLLAGIALGHIDLRNVFCRKKVYILSTVRLLVLPVASIALLKLIRADSLVSISILPMITVIASAAPSGTLVNNLAEVNHSDPDGDIVAVISFTMITCIITIPMIAQIYQLIFNV